MRRLRVGLIGAGAWTIASHLPNLGRRADELEFVAVNRRDPQALAGIRERYGFQIASTDFRDVIGAGLDVCIVASPARYHHEQVRAALESGAHVLVEKPFTLSSEEAWDLVDVAARTQRHLLVAFGANYQPMIRAAKRLMEEDGGIGTVEHVMVHMASVTRELLVGQPHPFEVAGYAADASVTTARPETSADASLSGGGYATAQLSHALGLALWLTGLRAREVFGRTWPTRQETRVELHDAAVLGFENGAIGTLSGGSVHWGANRNKHQQEVRVIGSDGQLHVDVEREIVWRYRGPDDDIRLDVQEGDGDYECRGPVDALIDLASGRNVVNASPAELGARVVEVIETLYRSAATGRMEAVERP